MHFIQIDLSFKGKIIITQTYFDFHIIKFPRLIKTSLLISWKWSTLACWNHDNSLGTDIGKCYPHEKGFNSIMPKMLVSWKGLEIGITKWLISWKEDWHWHIEIITIVLILTWVNANSMRRASTVLCPKFWHHERALRLV